MDNVVRITIGIRYSIGDVNLPLRPCTHGNVFLRFCIVPNNELVVIDSLENSKQYKNAGKRFRVYGASVHFNKNSSCVEIKIEIPRNLRSNVWSEGPLPWSEMCVCVSLSLLLELFVGVFEMAAVLLANVSTYVFFFLKTVIYRNSATGSVEQELLFVGQESGKLIAIRDIIQKVNTILEATRITNSS